MPTVLYAQYVQRFTTLHGPGRISLHTVERLTRTQVVLQRITRRFRRRDGREVGAGEHRCSWIRPTTQEDRVLLQARALRRDILALAGEFKRSQCQDLLLLERIKALLEQAIENAE